MNQATPARTVREFKELVQTDPSEVYFIRNTGDWKAYIRDVDKQTHPLRRVPNEVIRNFTESLIFNGSGLAGANVGILQEKLTYQEYKDLLAVFGMSIVFAEDHQAYACVGVGDCAVNKQHYLHEHLLISAISHHRSRLRAERTESFMASCLHEQQSFAPFDVTTDNHPPSCFCHASVVRLEYNQRQDCTRLNTYS
jgi:hypothetical protein